MHSNECLLEDSLELDTTASRRTRFQCRNPLQIPSSLLLSHHIANENMTMGAMPSPDLLQSPYRLPAIPKSASGGDLVSGIVDKFNSLTVVDKDEQREHYERQISKLKAALDRAQVAREEAESEARKLREKMLDLQDERQKEKTALRERAQEFEVRVLLPI